MASTATVPVPVPVPEGNLATNLTPTTRVPYHRSAHALRYLVAVILAVSFVVAVVAMLGTGHLQVGSASGTAAVPSPRPGIAPHAFP